MTKCSKKWSYVVRGFLQVGTVVVLSFQGVAIASAASCDDASTTVEMERCLQSKLNGVTEELALLQRTLHTALTESERAILNRASVAWLEYRDTTCQGASILYRGGSMEAIVLLSCRVRMTSERIKELGAIYKERLRGLQP